MRYSIRSKDFSAYCKQRFAIFVYSWLMIAPMILEDGAIASPNEKQLCAILPWYGVL
jgi:hypothetical protein